MPPLCPIYVRAFQEYLEALAESDDVVPRRQRRLLLSYAEFLFKLRGGGKCAVCRMSVRHVLPVRVERKNGLQLDYACLCTRCIEAEKAVATRIVLEVGQARIEHHSHHREYDVHTSPHQDFRKKSLKAKAS